MTGLHSMARNSLLTASLRLRLRHGGPVIHRSRNDAGQPREQHCAGGALVEPQTGRRSCRLVRTVPGTSGSGRWGTAVLACGPARNLPSERSECVAPEATRHQHFGRHRPGQRSESRWRPMRPRQPRVHAFTLRHSLAGLAVLGLAEPDARLTEPLPACEALARELARYGSPDRNSPRWSRFQTILATAVTEVHAVDPAIWPIPAATEVHPLLTPAAWGCDAVIAALGRACSEEHFQSKRQLGGLHRGSVTSRPYWVMCLASEAASRLRQAAVRDPELPKGQPDYAVGKLLSCVARDQLAFFVEPPPSTRLALVPPEPRSAPPPSPSPLVGMASLTPLPLCNPTGSRPQVTRDPVLITRTDYLRARAEQEQRDAPEPA